MSTSSIKNVLCVGAHPDDLELMAGGTVAKLVQEGCSVRFLTFTNGAWQSPAGEWQRDPSAAIAEGAAAAASLGVEVENLGLPAMDLRYEDRLVVELLQRIEQFEIDTMICPWEHDLHHDHEVVSRLAVAAGRKVPRVLMGVINFHLREVFTPNMFVDITNTWDQKIASLECYVGQWSRAKGEWLPWLDETSRSYGRYVGAQRAEGFLVRKFRLD